LIALLALFAAACSGPQILAPGPGGAGPFVEAGDKAFIARDGYRLRWSVWRAERPWGVMVALHGMNDYGETFRPAAEHWAREGLTVYAYDQRGFGRTLGDGLWPGTKALVHDAHDAIALASRRHPGLPVFLAGESMGGAAALAAMGDPEAPPIAGLILIAPGLQGWSRLSFLERAGLWAIAHATPSEPLSGRGLNLKASDNNDRLRAMAADPFVLKRVRADAFYGLVRLMDDATAAAAQVRTRVLILFGTQDGIAPIEPARDLHRTLGPRSTLTLYEGEFHLLLYGRSRERVWADIASFCRDRSARSALTSP
jgi:alpha-beta hydrolase superfamily lysophospholipase